jgi:hypothetical protein
MASEVYSFVQTEHAIANAVQTQFIFLAARFAAGSGLGGFSEKLELSMKHFPGGSERLLLHSQTMHDWI